MLHVLFTADHLYFRAGCWSPKGCPELWLRMYWTHILSFFYSENDIRLLGSLKATLLSVS